LERSSPHFEARFAGKLEGLERLTAVAKAMAVASAFSDGGRRGW
jgi:hypothetical protein